MTLPRFLFAAASFAGLGVASLFPLPAPTPASNDKAAANGWAPTPTVRAELLRRQDSPRTTCGYFDGDASELFDCEGHFCGYNSFYSWFGCCLTTALYSGSVVPTGCPIRTACVPYTELSQCTGSCAEDPLVLLCTNQASPYCVAATVMETTGYTDLGCGTSPFLVGVLQTPTASGPVPSQAPPSEVISSVQTPQLTQSPLSPQQPSQTPSQTPQVLPSQQTPQQVPSQQSSQQQQSSEQVTPLTLPTAATSTTSAVPVHVSSAGADSSLKQAGLGVVGAVLAVMNML